MNAKPSKTRKSQDLVKEISDLGNVLVRMCLVGEDDVASACRQQVTTGKRIGETLMEMGLITAEQLGYALDIQKRMRSTEGNLEAMAELLEMARTNVLERMRRLSS